MQYVRNGIPRTQMSRLPISTICPPSPRAAREAATIPLEVREFKTGTSYLHRQYIRVPEVGVKKCNRFDAQASWLMEEKCLI
jgi:hypothetical protein